VNKNVIGNLSAVEEKVCIALSSLYLDTDVTLMHSFIGSQLGASGMTLEEVENLLVFDVHPVLSGNLLRIAGEWDGFDESLLIAQINNRRLRGKKRVRPGFIFRDSSHPINQLQSIWRNFVA
jgi:hypothetical protein